MDATTTPQFAPEAGQGSHLLDDKRRFVVVSHLPVPFNPQGLVALNYLSLSRASLKPINCHLSGA